ncbi:MULTISPECIES: hypothetical protein [Nostoc]|uniref:Uncharacterized protein n=1 Tax=Nostoc paludosum FACHB-159 TaxID=2692908 RepID=A0ABR8KLN9_9NOSO|nr:MULTISPECIES: hypothetical protein [Nostoc]MBD2682550.1 hypothetical protein [Nostoc sp. FACHB-857]MBD2738882.1 hypothetical protein [Nostoc paludosum FACHB-159]
MASSGINDSNSLTEQGINLQISGVERIILPVPEKKPNANTLVDMNISIVNNSLIPFRFNRSGTLIPQIVGSDEQVLQIQEPRDRRKSNKYDDYLVTAGEKIFAFLYVQIYWLNNKLQLQIPSTSTELSTESDNFWKVNNIELGIYTLRFIYRTNIKTAVGIETVRLYTQSIILHLIEPVQGNNRIVEFDGIRFETLVPKQILIIPEKQPESTTFVQFGLNITNMSSTPYRFKFHGLKPEIQSSAGKLLRRLYNINASIGIEESHFLVAVPGETLTCFLDCVLYWESNDQLVMRGRDSIGGYWFFTNLNSGSYQVRFTYKGSTQSSVTRLLRGIVIENLWTGIVTTPFIDFQLVNK